jgi:DNA-directed RNA polymerase specialized sigma24 family protein
MAQRFDIPAESFPSTQWTLVVSAGADGISTQPALERLLKQYIGPMRSHLVRRLGIRPDAADDLLQGFILSQVVERHLIRRAERGKGKFRSFLLTALKRYVSNELRNQRAQKRGGGQTDSLCSVEEPTSSLADPAEHLHFQWAQQVIQTAISRMKADCELFKRQDVWGIFEDRVVKPAFEGIQSRRYSEMSRLFNIASSEQASNILMTGKRMFARCLKSVVAEYEPNEANIGMEIAELRKILSMRNSSSSTRS